MTSVAQNAPKPALPWSSPRRYSYSLWWAGMPLNFAVKPAASASASVIATAQHAVLAAE